MIWTLDFTEFPALLGVFYLAVVAWPLAKTDWRERRLPNRLVLPAIPITLTGQLAAVALGAEWWRVGQTVMLAVAAFGIGLALNRWAGLGMGDVKLIAALALALGWWGIFGFLIALGLAFALASLVVAVLAAVRRSRFAGNIPFINEMSASSSIPLGPYLLIGFVLVLTIF